MPPRKRLGQLLTELKVIDEAQLQSALGHQKQWGGKIGAILVEKGFCREDQLVAVLSQHLGIPTVKLVDSQVDPRAVKAVSRSVAERLHVFAYEVVGAGRSEVVSVAMSDPTDLSAVDQLAFHTGKRIKAMLASDSEILAAIEQHYPEGAKGKSTGSTLRPVAPAAARPPPLRVAPPVATPVEPVQKLDTARGLPYIPPPVPQNAKPAPRELEEIEPELPQAGEVNAHGFEAEQERMREAYPATEAIEPPAEPEEPMSLETPTNLQGWKEGPQKPGIDWAATPVDNEPVPAAGATNTPPESARVDTEPVPEAAAPEAASDWHGDEQPPSSAEASEGEAPSEWQTPEEPARAEEQAPAEWRAAEEPAEPAAEWQGGEAPAEWQAEAEQTATEEAAPAEWQGEAETGPTEAAPAEWQAGSEGPAATEEAPPTEEAAGTQEAAATEEAPAEWHAEGEETQRAPAEWSGSEEPTGEHRAEGEPAAAMEAEGRGEGAEWSHSSGETTEVPQAAPSQEPEREWSAQEPRVSEAETSGEVPQDAWEDEPVEDATDAPAQWREGAEAEAGSEGSAFAAEAPEEGGAIALPGPNEPAIAEAFAESSALEEAPAQEPASPEAGTYGEDVPLAYEGAAEVRESTDRFQRPAITPPFGVQSPSSEAAPEGAATQAEEWPAAEATQEELEWVASEPLSAADLATLAALGIDPADGTGAMRTLACLIRVLNRRQAIDVEELAAEIRESRATSALSDETSSAADALGDAPPESQ